MFKLVKAFLFIAMYEYINIQCPSRCSRPIPCFFLIGPDHFNEAASVIPTVCVNVTSFLCPRFLTFRTLLTS